MLCAFLAITVLAGTAIATPSTTFAHITYARRQEPRHNFTVELKVPRQIHGSHNFHITGTIANRGTFELLFNPRWTVLDTLQSDIVSIVTRGEKFRNRSPTFIGAIGWHGSSFERLPGWLPQDGQPPSKIGIEEADWRQVQAYTNKGQKGGWVILKPGHAISFIVDLGQRYNFRRLTGPFEISLRNHTFRSDHVITNRNGFPSQIYEIHEFKTNPGVFDLVGDRGASPYTVQPTSFVFDEGEGGNQDGWESVLRPGWGIKHENIRCSNDQKNQVIAAAMRAFDGMKKTIQWMLLHDASDPTFRKWFGDVWDIQKDDPATDTESDPATHYSTVLRRFRSMVATYDGMGFSCNCAEDGPVAQVAAGFPMIYLCDRWFSASPGPTPGGGINQDGTIVHELTHFVFNGGARDTLKSRYLEDYRPELQALAQKSLLVAIHEADSYRAFYNDIVSGRA